MLKDYHMTPNRAGIPVWRPAQPVIGREDEHQTALTNWARMTRTQYPALTLYHHIPNGGIAKRVSWSESTVKRRLRAAMKKLKGDIKDGKLL